MRKVERFRRWLVHDPNHTEHPQSVRTHTQPWWRVMCLTGVDYFSSLGYQPSIAALAAGPLAPVATLVLVALTLLGALPMYRRVASESPHGDGSISMLERLLQGWSGKAVVLALIGFVATGFVITITLSAADAAKHIIENPFWPAGWDIPVPLTLLLIALLAMVFLVGFREAIGVAVVLVVLYIGLSLVVVTVGLGQVNQQPQLITQWWSNINLSYASPMAAVIAALVVFPKLALGLSGFETGVVVMPLVKGDPNDSPQHPKGRIRNSHKLLTGAALIMSVMLLGSSVTTTWLIPPEAFTEGGEANGRALSYLAHQMLGDAFGSVYDLSTILILWFAGASAMAGLLNVVPRYLPRYGMAPEWSRATRPLVLIYTLICLVVTVLFDASVDAQGAAYATGVLALMASAAVAVTLSAVHQRQRLATWGFTLISVVFIYTLLANIIEQPSGLKIAVIFILLVMLVSLVSRVSRSTELRVDKVEFDEEALRIIRSAGDVLRIIPNHRDVGNGYEYNEKARNVRELTHLPPKEPVIFLEVGVIDASDFSTVIHVRGVEVGQHKILRTESSAVPNTIAAVLLHLRQYRTEVPHIYFHWSSGRPLSLAIRFVLFGEGDIPPLTHAILRQAEPQGTKRPVVHVGG